MEVFSFTTITPLYDWIIDKDESLVLWRYPSADWQASQTYEDITEKSSCRFWNSLSCFHLNIRKILLDTKTGKYLFYIVTVKNC